MGLNSNKVKTLDGKPLNNLKAEVYQIRRGNGGGVMPSASTLRPAGGYEGMRQQAREISQQVNEGEADLPDLAEQVALVNLN